MKQFMPELTAKERLMILQENAAKVEQTTYHKALTEEERGIKKDILTENSIKLFDLEEEKKEAVKLWKDKIDPLKKENSLLLSEIRTGQTKVDGTLFHLANHDDGMMETYDNDGYLISSRRLRPEEKQATIFSLSKTANQ